MGGAPRRPEFHVGYHLPAPLTRVEPAREGPAPIRPRAPSRPTCWPPWPGRAPAYVRMLSAALPDQRREALAALVASAPEGPQIANPSGWGILPLARLLVQLGLGDYAAELLERSDLTDVPSPGDVVEIVGHPVGHGPTIVDRFARRGPHRPSSTRELMERGRPSSTVRCRCASRPRRSAALGQLTTWRTDRAVRCSAGRDQPGRRWKLPIATRVRALLISQT